MKMTKRCLALVLALLLAMGTAGALADVKINKTNFPDANFRKYVQQNIDTNGDGKLTAKEMNAVKELQLYNMGIKDLKGIENFKKLETLSCEKNKLKKVDLSKNTRLMSVDVNGNKSLTSLKLGNLKKLEMLRVMDVPKLKSLDLGGCPIVRKAVGQQLIDASSKHASYGLGEEQPNVYADVKLTMKKGSKVLRKYGKPTAIKLSKKAATMHMGNEFVWSDFDVFIKTTPATAVYPIKISSSNQDVVDTYYDYFYGLSEGESTLTVSCGKATATLKVTVEY